MKLRIMIEFWTSVSQRSIKIVLVMWWFELKNCKWIEIRCVCLNQTFVISWEKMKIIYWGVSNFTCRRKYCMYGKWFETEKGDALMLMLLKIRWLKIQCCLPWYVITKSDKNLIQGIRSPKILTDHLTLSQPGG